MLSIDNAAMIAAAGLQLRAGSPRARLNADAGSRSDETFRAQVRDELFSGGFPGEARNRSPAGSDKPSEPDQPSCTAGRARVAAAIADETGEDDDRQHFTAPSG